MPRRRNGGSPQNGGSPKRKRRTGSNSGRHARLSPSRTRTDESLSVRSPSGRTRLPTRIRTDDSLSVPSPSGRTLPPAAGRSFSRQSSSTSNSPVSPISPISRFRFQSPQQRSGSRPLSPRTLPLYHEESSRDSLLPSRYSTNTGSSSFMRGSPVHRKRSKNVNSSKHGKQSPAATHSGQDSIGYASTRWGSSRSPRTSSSSYPGPSVMRRRNQQRSMDSIFSNSLYEESTKMDSEIPIPGLGISTAAATITMAKYMCGAAVLQFASAGYNGGMASIVGGIPLVAAVHIYSALQLVKVIDLLEKTQPGIRLETYADISRGVLGKPGYIFTKALFNFALTGMAIYQVVNPALVMAGCFPNLPLTEFYWMLIFACIYVPFSWMSNLAAVSRLGIFGVIAVLLLIAVIVFTSIRYTQDDTGVVDHGAWSWFPTLQPGEVKSPVAQFLSTFCVWANGFGAIIVTPSTRHIMRNKSGLTHAVTASHTIVAVAYVCMAIPCIFGIASGLLWSSNIVVLMNSPIKAPPANPAGGFLPYNPSPSKSWEAYAATICIVFSISVSFPLICRILTAEAEKTWPVLERNSAMRIGWRSTFVLTMMLIGFLSGPYLGLFLTFLGALGLLPLQFVIPSILIFALQYRIHGSVAKACKRMGFWSVMLHVLVLSCSFIIITLGVYDGILQIQGLGQNPVRVVGPDKT